MTSDEVKEYGERVERMAKKSSVFSDDTLMEISVKTADNAQDSRFQQLLSETMKRRWGITAVVLFTFLFIAAGIALAVYGNHELGQEWKEILLLMLGAFIGSYGKIIDYWFSDTDKDKMLVQKMDEEDGSSLSNTMGG